MPWDVTTDGQSSGSRVAVAMAGGEDWIAEDRWTNEGGRLGLEAGEPPPRVEIAGGGVAGAGDAARAGAQALQEIAEQEDRLAPAASSVGREGR